MGRVENFVIRSGYIYHERQTVFAAQYVVQSALVFRTETAGFELAGGFERFLDLLDQICIADARTVDILAGSKDVSGVDEFADVVGNVQSAGVIEKEKNILHDNAGSLTYILLAAGADGADCYNPEQKDEGGDEKAFAVPEIFAGKPGNPCNDDG